MSNKIQLTPSELQSQANEMKSLQAEYVSLFGGVTGELNKVNTNWSPNLANNFSGKITSAQKSFTQVTQMLMDGAEVADTCAVTFESVDSQLSKKMYCEDGKESKTEFGDVVKDIAQGDIEGLQDIFNFIDDKYDSIPEPVRNLIKNYLLKKVKHGDVAIKDIYDILDDIVTGNFSWGTVSDIIGVGADVAGNKSSFIQSLKTTLKIMPTYLEKANKLDDKIDAYVADGNVFGAVFTGIIGEGTTIIQGATDGICKIIDKTLHLSDISDVIEIATGGKIDIGGYLKKGGQGISDAFDYITDLDNYSDIGRYYKEFYGQIGDGIATGAKAVADVAVGACESIGNFFKKLF